MPAPSTKPRERNDKMSSPVSRDAPRTRPKSRSTTSSTPLSPVTNNKVSHTSPSAARETGSSSRYKYSQQNKNYAHENSASPSYDSKRTESWGGEALSARACPMPSALYEGQIGRCVSAPRPDAPLHQDVCQSFLVTRSSVRQSPVGRSVGSPGPPAARCCSRSRV